MSSSDIPTNMIASMSGLHTHKRVRIHIRGACSSTVVITLLSHISTSKHYLQSTKYKSYHQQSSLPFPPTLRQSDPAQRFAEDLHHVCADRLPRIFAQPYATHAWIHSCTIRIYMHFKSACTHLTTHTHTHCKHTHTPS